MKEKIIDDHLNDSNNVEKIEKNLNKVKQNQKELKRMIEFFVLALILIFAMYSFF